MQRIPRIKVEQRLPQKLTVSDIKLLLNSPDQSTVKGVRDFTILECLYSTGLRVSECVQLRVTDIDFDEGMLSVLGKGKKQRCIPLTRGLNQSLRIYLKQRPEDSIWLFPSSKGSHLSRQTVFSIIQFYAKQVALSIANVSPHSFRHAFATHLIEGDARLRDVQLLLGHTHLSSTQLYTKISNTYVKSAYIQAHPRAIL